MTSTFLKSLLLASLMCAAQAASIDGVVTNRTTNKPAAQIDVTLLRLGQGMQSVGTVKTDAQGRFHFEDDLNAPHLIQANWQGVRYNMQVPPGTASTQLDVPVFDVKTEVAGLEAGQHLMVIETDGTELVINETIVYDNKGNVTWNDDRRGTARIAVPEAAGKNVMARVIPPAGMPLDQPVRSDRKGEYLVAYPIKPGQTRFDFSYRMPVKDPITLTGRQLAKGAAIRLVAPPGVTLSGEAISPLGTEPTTGANVFDVTKSPFEVTIKGSGSLTSLQPTERGQDETPGIERIVAPGYDRVWKWVLGLTIAILALAFWAQYLKGAPEPPAAATAAGGRRGR